MQKEIADAIGLPMGPLTTISTSAHVYEESFAQIQDLIKEYYPKLPCEQDPRGNYVIKLNTKDPKGKYIEVIHMNPQGRKVAIYKGTKAMEIFNEIANNGGVSVFVHALDLGAELQKAEIALQHGLEYTQDRPLTLEKLNTH
jgi:thymidylate synthase